MMKKFLSNQRVNRRAKPLFSPRREYGHFLEPAVSYGRKLLKTLKKTGKLRVIAFAASGVALSAAVFITVFIIVGARKVSAEPMAIIEEAPAEETTAQAEPASPPSVTGGSGLPNIDRDQEISHTVMDGETFSEIAYVYKIEMEKLAAYNRIPDINRIKEGTIIRIPSYGEEKKITPAAVFQTKKLTGTGTINPVQRIASGVPLKIDEVHQFDGTAVTVHFSAKSPPGVDLKQWVWNLGNGRKSFRPTTFWTYEEPGTYTVTLSAEDSEGRIYQADELLIDVPHPATYQYESQVFLTLESMEQTFSVTGIVKTDPTANGKLDVPMVEVSTTGESTVYRATRPGFFRFEAEKDGIVRNYYMFVSPVESRHSDRSDMNWYRTQFNSGTQSNCGPASAAMAISWATGQYVAVSAARVDIGWKNDGATSFEELMSEMEKYQTNSRLTRVYSVKDITDIIDRGNIAIVLYNSGGPSLNKYPENDLFGKYYYDAVGHYLVVKGYSTDRKYFVVYDAIPSDWGSNSFRYADGISMIGRNRYYEAQEVFDSLRRSDVIEVMRTAPAELGY